MLTAPPADRPAPGPRLPVPVERDDYRAVLTVERHGRRVKDAESSLGPRRVGGRAAGEAHTHRAVLVAARDQPSGGGRKQGPCDRAEAAVALEPVRLEIPRAGG